jgi:arylsulfatase A-like enzyme
VSRLSRRLGGGMALVAIAAAVTVLWMWSGLDRPSVVLISIDTLRQDHVSAYGYSRRTTPSLQAFSREAVVFEEAFAANTNTAPAHASMLTALYPFTHGIVRNHHRLKAGVTTMGEVLQEAGYETAGFVSGYTLQRAHTGLDRGFHHYDDEVSPRGDRPATMTYDAATRWLRGEARGQEPLFLFFHLFDPHFPYTPPTGYARLFTEHAERGPGRLHRLRAQGGGPPSDVKDYIGFYDGEIAFADAHVGRLMVDLWDSGLWDDALVVVVSDHGETLDDRSLPFRHGSRVYEEQIRVPLMIRFPGGRYGGARIRAPVHHVDIMPTILDYLELSLPDAAQGQSLMPLIRGDAAPDPARPIFTTARPEPAHVPEVDQPLVKTGLITAIRVWPLKLIAYPTEEGHVHQLFDLAQDPGEHENLAAERPDAVRALAARLRSWRAAVGGDREIPEPSLSPEAEDMLRSLGYVE